VLLYNNVVGDGRRAVILRSSLPLDLSSGGFFLSEMLLFLPIQDVNAKKQIPVYLLIREL